jgi:hypothetical protein
VIAAGKAAVMYLIAWSGCGWRTGGRCRSGRRSTSRPSLPRVLQHRQSEPADALVRGLESFGVQAESVGAVVGGDAAVPVRGVAEVPDGLVC